MRRLQSNLSKTVLKSDDLFQKDAFFWTGLFVIGVCLEVTRLVFLSFLFLCLFVLNLSIILDEMLHISLFRKMLLMFCVCRYYGGRVSNPDFDGPNELMQLFINLMYFFVLFLSLSIFGAKLTETAHACTMLVHRIINHPPIPENLEIFSQAHLLVSQMNKPEIVMTGMAFQFDHI